MGPRKAWLGGPAFHQPGALPKFLAGTLVIMLVGRLNGRLIIRAGQFDRPQDVGLSIKKIQSIDAHAPGTPNRSSA